MSIKDTAFVDILCQGCSVYRELPTAVIQGRAAGTLCSYNRICSLAIEVWGHMWVASVRGEADYGLRTIHVW